VREVRDGAFHGGVYSFGLKEGGVGFVENPALIPDSVRVVVAGLERDIIAGRIRVPVGS
jgi:basic membrane lipoprotein Med (substrate-binding protein (PBP1-ABC) superfamily)